MSTNDHRYLRLEEVNDVEATVEVEEAEEEVCFLFYNYKPRIG